MIQGSKLSPSEEIMMEVSRREKQAGITPEADIDTCMKVNNLQEVQLSIMFPSSGSLVCFPFNHL